MLTRSGERALRDPNRVERLAEIVARAAVIVRATVVSADPARPTASSGGDAPDTYAPQTATIRVAEVLAGDATPGPLAIAKPTAAYFLTADPDDPSPDARHAGLFVLEPAADGSGTPTLFGHLGVYAGDFDRRAFERVLAGLPERPAGPSPADLRALAERSDAVVAGTVVADGPVEFTDGRVAYTVAGTLTVDEVLRGPAVTGPLAVVRGQHVFEVGAKWGFRTDLPTHGVLFLDLSSTPAVVLNPVDPFTLEPRPVKRALGG